MKKPLFALALLAAAAGSARGQSTTLASVSSAGAPGNRLSGDPSITPDGRFVAFYSDATNLVPDDTNSDWDVFVRDRISGETSRASVSSSGSQGEDDSFSQSISADGRFVAFVSIATNLVPNDTNGFWDVFVHDRSTGETTRVSVPPGGGEANAGSQRPSISADGRYVAFESEATNLVPGDVNRMKDVFVRDRTTGETARVSVDSAGGEANWHCVDPEISGDGRFVAFVSLASDLVPGDGNGFADVFVHDRVSGETTRASVDSSGGGGDSSSFEASISADGRFVAFESGATNFVPGDRNLSVDVFVHDRATGTIVIASLDSAGVPGIGYSGGVSISARGRFVTFSSDVPTFFPGDTNGRRDTFVRDLLTGETSLVSRSTGGVVGDTTSLSGEISADGRFVAFTSSATNLVSTDANGASDVFLRDLYGCGAGVVNAGAGDATDVLFVNDSAGGPERTVRLATYEPLTIFMALPPAATGPCQFALFAWGVVPAPSAPPFVLPLGTGETCLPTPITGGSPAPLLVWNNTGSPLAGAPTRPSSPAPSIVVNRSRAFPRPVRCYLQGVIRDAGAPNGFAAATNGVKIEIR